jgi:hypothetical protein
MGFNLILGVGCCVSGQGWRSYFGSKTIRWSMAFPDSGSPGCSSSSSAPKSLNLVTNIGCTAWQNSLLFHRYLILVFLPNSLDDRFASEDRRTRNQLGSALRSSDHACNTISKSFASHKMMKHMTQLDFSSNRPSLPLLPASRNLPRSIPTALPLRQPQRLPLISRLMTMTQKAPQQNPQGWDIRLPGEGAFRREYAW